MSFHILNGNEDGHGDLSEQIFFSFFLPHKEERKSRDLVGRSHPNTNEDGHRDIPEPIKVAEISSSQSK
jgi:hypothetical protein